MNKHLHRIVFNKKRGQLMAVAETASSDAKAPGTSTGAASLGITATLRSLSFALFTALGLITLASPLANAQIVADPNAPKNQQPTVLNAGNGVPLVNIQTPSAAGISRNTYSQFDVNGQGAILNNSRSNVQTQLGGWVQGNPWLANGTARVILNEVNASNPSQLRGYIEVAGQRAQVVIANAAGITCDGCGFLNASRATLTTGTPIVNGGSLEGYRVQRGVVSIEGAGLDASRTDYTDIIARAVQANASIWANELKVTTGVNEVDAGHTQATPTTASGVAPSFAIDVAQLGGMYAGKITLVGTEAGVGVRNTGVIGASAGNVVVTADGRLENAGRITATGSVLADTQGGIANSGIVYAQGDTQLNTRGNIDNGGVIAAQGNTTLAATGRTSQVDATADSVLAAGLRSDGSLGAAGALNITSTNEVAAHGQNLATSSISVTASAVDISQSQTSARDINLSASSADIDASRATLAAAQTLTASAARTLRTDGAQVSAEQLTLSARSISNVQGELVQTGSGDTSLQLAGDLNNTGGRIATNGQNLALSAQTLANTEGRIEHAGAGQLTLAAVALDGERGYIGTQGQLAASTGQAQLNGAITVAGRLSLQATSLSNRGGQIVQTGTGDTALSVAQGLDNTGGVIASNGSTTLTAQSLVNQGGTVQAAGAASLRVSTTGLLDNSAEGRIAAAGRAVLAAGALNNQRGHVSAAGSLDAQATQGVDNTDGALVSSEALNVTAARLDNTRGTVESGMVNFGVGGLLTNAQGQVFATSDLHVQAGDIDNTGSLYAQGQASVSANGRLVNAGVIAAQGHTTLQAQRLESQAGSLLGAGIRGDGTLAVSGDLIITTGGALVARGQNLAAGQMRMAGTAVDLTGSQTGAHQVSLTATQGDVSTREAVVSATGTLGITANAQATQTLDNRAGQLSAQQLDLHVANLANAGGSVVQTGNGDSSITGLGQLDNTGGRIASNGHNLSLSAQALTNTDGRIEHAGSGTLVVNASTLDGARGALLSNGSLQLAAQAATLDAGTTSAARLQLDTAALSNRSGQIVQTGVGATTIKATTRLDNTGGVLASNGATSVSAGELLNQGGVIQATGASNVDVTVTAELDNSANGFIAAGGNTVISAGQLLNQQGRVTAGASLSVNAARALDNTDGLLAGNQDLSVAAASLDNTRGTLQAVQGAAALNVGAAFTNAQGQAFAGTDLAVQAGDVSNTGSLYAQGSVALTASGALSNAGVIAAQGNTTLQASRLDSSAGSLLAAGLRGDGSLAGSGDLTVTTAQALVARGQNLAAGLARLRGASIDVSGSQTGSRDVALSATAGDIDAHGATVAASQTLGASATQTLRTDAAQLWGLQLQLSAHDLSNVQGELVQTGSGDTTIALAGDLDNTGGRIAANSRNLALSARTLVNADGRIEHAGNDTLNIDVLTLNGTRGVVVGNGALVLTAQTAVLDAGGTSARRIMVDTQTLSNRGGQIVQTGSEATAIAATTYLDNTGGLLASNGATTLRVGDLRNQGGTAQAAGASSSLDITATGELDNSAQGTVTAGGNVAVRAGQLSNEHGRLLAGASLTATVAQNLDNTDGLVAANQNLGLTAAGLDNTRGTLQALGNANLQVGATLVNAQGQINAGTDLGVQAATLDNGGGLYAQGNASVSTTDVLTNTGFIAAGGNTTLQGGRIDSAAAGLLAAGLRSDGSLADRGNLSVTATQALAAHGQNVAAGTANFAGATVDLSRSQTGAADLTLVATQGSITTSQAVVSAGGTLSATANRQAGQALNNDAGQLTARQLDLHLANLSNVQGELVQTGTGDTTVALSGSLDNAGGRIAANSRNLALSAQTFTNVDGRIEHANTGTLAVDAATLDGTRGVVATNGTMQLAAQSATLDAASTVAAQLALDTATLSNRGGQIIQTGTGSMAVAATTRLDNTGGLLASNGGATLTLGELANRGGTVQAAGAAGVSAGGLLDNSANGLITAGGNTVLNAGQLNNLTGRVLAGASLAATVAQAADNTDGVLAANGNLTLTGGGLDNTRGTTQALGAVGLQLSGAFINTQGQAYAGGDLTVRSGSVSNTGSLYAQGDSSLTVTGTLTNTGVIAAQGDTTLQARRIDSQAGSLLAAGLRADGTLSFGGNLSATAGEALVAHGQNIAVATGRFTGATVDLSGSQTSGAGLSLTATQGAITTSQAVVSAAGTLSATANNQASQALDNNAGQLTAAQLDLHVANLSNVQGLIVQTGSGDTTIALGGNFDNRNGRLAANSGNLAVTAQTLTNTDGRIEHAGAGELSLTAGTFDGVRGQVASNGTLRLTATDAVLDAGSTVAQGLQLQTQTLSNRGGQIIQTGSGATVISALTRLDNTGGTLAGNGNASIVAGDVANQGGTIQAASLNLQASGAVDNRAQGQLSAGGAMSIEAAELNNAQGQVTAGQRLQLHATQAVDNAAGVMAARGDVVVDGGRIDNTLGTIGSVQGGVTATAADVVINSTGRIEAAQAVTVTATGITNTDGVVAGQGLRIDSRAQALDNTRGTLAARETLDVQSGALRNDAGLIQAGGALVVNTHGQALVNTNSSSAGGIIGQGSVTLATGELNNQAGFIGSHGGLTVTSAAVRNTQGGVLTGEAAIALQASSLDNRGGQVQALGDVTLNAGAGSVDNTGSLVRSGGTLTVSAGSIANANTQGANQGLEGRSVALTFGSLDNTSGAIRADESLTLTGSGSLGNHLGLVSSGKAISVLDANTSAKTLAVNNTTGTLIAGEAVTVDTASLSGDGKLLSEGDLTVRLNGDYTHTGDFQANGTATLQTTGTLTNQAKLLAGNTLNVSAANIDNTAAGEISAANTNVSASGTLTNRGLVDGQETFVSAGTLNNLGTGRIYGDHVAISATTLNNDVENGTAATIAARARLDVGAQSVTNRERALIFSAGDMAIGGSLDANRLATGQAATVNNHSATIEALGSLDLSARQINNTNEHFSTQVAEVSREARQDFQLAGSPNIYDSTQASQNNGASDDLLQAVTPEGTRDDFVRYDYNRIVTETQVLISDPGQILAGGAMRITADAFVNDRSRVIAGATLTGSIGMLSNLGADGQRTTTDAGTSTHFFRIRHKGRDEQGASASAYNPAATVVPIKVGMATYLQNTAVAGTGTQIAALTSNTVTETAAGAGDATAGLRSGTLIEVRAAVSAPASASGSTVATASGSGAGVAATAIDTAAAVNAPGAASASTVAAATGAAANQHVGAVGGTSVAVSGPTAATGAGASTATAADVSRSAAAVDAAAAVASPSTVAGASVSSATAAAASQATTAIASNGEAATAPATAVATTSFVIRAVVPNTTLPNSSLFRQNPDANARFLVETDPRFADYRSWLSSDYLLQQLELDPAMTQKRLGDGFYEQKLIREQVAQLTGRRFLEGYANDEAQYQALMGAGVTYAKQWKLVPGVALTSEQMAQLTTDIVWLVERPVTLADGSVQKVLVPQVYVRVKEGDIDGSGALLSAGAIGLNLSGDLNNGGTIAGRTVVSLTAENVQNLGGRISGQDVAVSARNDLNHLGGLIDAGNSLSVSAGRDLNVVTGMHGTSNDQSSRTNVGRVAGLYVGNAGGTLVAAAGRDINLIAASIVNAGESGQTVIAAGRDLKLGTVTESSRQSITWDANNWRKDASSAEVGTSIQAVGDVRLSAVNDLTARAATVTSSQGALTAVAGSNLSVTAGVATRDVDEAHKVSGSNSWTHKKTTTTRDTFEQTAVVGSTLSGHTVVLQAGDKAKGSGDLLIQGSSVTAQGAAVLSAGRDVTITSAEQATSTNHDSQTVKEAKGFAKAVGTALTATSMLTTGLPSPEGARLLTKKSNTQANEQTTTQAVGSTVSAGTLSVEAGRDATVQGSTLVADGHVDINAARNLNIVSTQNTQSGTSSASSKTSGFVGSFWQPAVGTVKQTQTGQERSTAQVASQVASLNGSVQLKAGEQYTQTSSQVLAPQGDIDIQAKQVDIGAAHDSGSATQTSQYSKTAIGGTVSVPLLNAVQGIQQSVQAGKTSGDARMQALAAVNAGMQAQAAAEQVAANGVAGGIKVSVSLGHSESRNQTTQSGSTAAGSQVTAGGDVHIAATGAGKDSVLNVSGSDIKAGQDATLKSDGALVLQAATNTAEQHSKNSSGGASVGVGFAFGGQQNGFTLEVSASRSLGKADGTDTSHANTHVSAGNALNLQSGGDTTLKGAVASGRQVTAEVGGDLKVESLQDRTKYDAKQQSAGVSVSVCVPPFCYGSSSVSASASQAKVQGDFVSVTEQSALQAGDGGFQVRVNGNTELKGGAISSSQAAIDANRNSLTTATLTTSDLQNRDDFKASAVSASGGTGGGSGGASQRSGHQASTTRAGISQANVVITDDKQQQAVSGQNAEQTVASLNRDVLTGKDTSGALGQAWDGQRLQEKVQAEASITAQFGQNAAKAVGDYAGGKVKELRMQAAAEADPSKRQALLDEASKWDEGGAYRVAAHAAVGGLAGGVQGALGAGASAATVPAIAEAVNGMGLPEPVRQVVIAAAGTAVGAAAGGTAGATAGFNQTANNYLKHEELKAKRDELAACKDQQCRESVNRKWDEVSQRRNEAMTVSCVDGASVQCRANLAELQTDMAALLANPSGRGLNRLTPEESNNLKQATEKYRTNLEVLAQRGNQALGTTAASPDQLVQAGYLSVQEAKDLKQLRLGQMVDFLGAVALPGGAKANGNKPVTKAMQEAEGASARATERARVENNVRRDDGQQYINNTAPKDVPETVTRRDNDFSSPVNDRGNPKASIDAEGNLNAANPQGTGSVTTHVRGSDPKNTPYISTTDPTSTEAPKNFGSQQVEINTRDLQRDINAGRVSPETTEIVPHQRVVEELQQKVDQAQARYERNPTQRNSERLEDAQKDLTNAARDGECLIKGCVPAPYVSVPKGTRSPIMPQQPKKQ